MVGGSERQSYLIGEYCEKYLLDQGTTSKVTPEEKQHFINQFRTLKKRLNASHDIEGASELLHLSFGNLRVKLTREIIRNAYDEAMGGAYQALYKALAPWNCEDRQQDLQVIVAGGTARSKALQEDIKSMCDTFGLDDPSFAESFGFAGRYRFASLS